ncbi:hypothetical protein SOVF_150110, partial [Spinacia oleracea]
PILSDHFDTGSAAFSLAATVTAESRRIFGQNLWKQKNKVFFLSGDVLNCSFIQSKSLLLKKGLLPWTHPDRVSRPLGVFFFSEGMRRNFLNWRKSESNGCLRVRLRLRLAKVVHP